jgi:hypothetical protein
MQHRLEKKKKKHSVEQYASLRAAKGSSVMSARIIELAAYRAQRLEESEASAARDAMGQSTRFHFWTGASGKRYVHTVYELLDCPELPRANYVLVRRESGRRRKVLSIGRVSHEAPSLNLADIRRRGAELGAHEVHVHLLAETEKLGKLIEFDLRTGQFEADIARFTAGFAN